jgi:undecaprenyl-diphosphatase
LAVVLTPAVVGYEVMRLVKATHEAAATGTALNLQGTLGLSLLGMGVALVADLIGLKWLSSWLESGKWYLFGIYCLVASGMVFYLHARGF